jgi:hypothetical protein
MRRYNLALGDREFVIDVQELTADRFPGRRGRHELRSHAHG